jgi:tripartite-type tricarboxylate transporter receptor subunit TctC
MNWRATLALSGVIACGAAWAQEYPAKPVRIVVSYAPGGAVDIVTRTVGQKVGELMGQPVVVDNRPGGNANIGAAMVAKATADGYTLLTVSTANVVNMSLFPNLTYDALRDFAPISQLGYGPQVLVMNTLVQVKSVQDLLALARAKPGQMSYASGGVGSSQHLAGELFKSIGQVDILHVPYKGGAPALVDVIGGRVAFMFINTLEALPHANTGKLRALAIASARRSAVFPETPTFTESGIVGFEAAAWWGFVAPAGTPKPIVAKLHGETVKALAAPDLKERFASLGAEILGSSPEQFAGFMRGEAQKWGAVIRRVGIKAQ